MRTCRCATSMRPCSALQGKLTVRNTLVAAADLRWRSGSAGRSKSSSARTGDTASTLSATGTAAAAQLKPFLPSAGQGLAARRAWRLATRVPQRRGRIGGAQPACASNRTCEAWASRLPEPLGKSESEQRPFQVTLESDRRRRCARARLARRRARNHARRAIRLRLVAGSRRHSRGRQCAGVAESSRLAHRGHGRALRAR